MVSQPLASRTKDAFSSVQNDSMSFLDPHDLGSCSNFLVIVGKKDLEYFTDLYFNGMKMFFVVCYAQY